MKDAWQLTATHTIDLGYEQLLILEGKHGARVKVLFRGVWLSGSIDPRRSVLGSACAAIGEPPRIGRLQRLADAIHLRLLMAPAQV